MIYAIIILFLWTVLFVYALSKDNQLVIDILAGIGFILALATVALAIIPALSEVLK